MHERRFNQAVDKLRSPERIARLEVERVVELCLKNLNADSVLDVGTGSALFAEKFAARGLRVAGVDVNPEMVEHARRFVPGGNFRVAPAEVVPFEDQDFDLVFMGVVLHEADDALKALTEARRIARMRVAILEWPYVEEEYGPPLAHRLSETKVNALAAEAGFGNVEMISLTHTVLYRLE